MKINKLSVITGLALGGLIACSSLVTAQDQRPGPGRRAPTVERRLERLTEELKLTDEQKPKVKAVLEQSEKTRQELRGDTSLTREDRREKARTLMADETKKMKEILTPDQFTKYEKLREEMRGARGGQRNPDVKTPPPADNKKD